MKRGNKGFSKRLLEASTVDVSTAVHRALTLLRQTRAPLAVAGLAAASIASAGPFPAQFDLASLLPANGGDGSAGFALNGVAANDVAGTSVSNAGDVNGDGIDDFIIGAPGTISATVPGNSFVVFGRDAGFPPEVELASLLADGGGDGSEGFVVVGFHDSDNLGESVSAAGDVNGDGIDDLIVGAPGLGGNEEGFGQAYLLFGRDTANMGDFPPEFDVSLLLPENGGDGSTGVVLDGLPVSDVGYSVSAAGDVNGDGIGDVVVGDELVGYVWVVFGRDVAQGHAFSARIDLETLLPGGGGDGSTGFAITGDDRQGASVASVGDVNADGIGDIILGAPNAHCFAGQSGCGQAFFVFGRDTARTGNFPALFDLEDLLPENGGDGSAGVAMDGSGGQDFAGASVASAGDVNGDGLDDAVIGASGGRGKAYVVFGRDTAQVGNFPSYLSLPSLQPPTGDGSIGFVVSGVPGAQEMAGASVSGAVDVDRDGVDDLVIGTHVPYQTIGKAYVVYGRDTAQAGDFPARFELASLLPAFGGDGSAGFLLQGIEPSDYAGEAVSRAGDVNGDGIGDLLVGAQLIDDSAGTTFVVLGRAPDGDADGVSDDVDACPATAIPESVPRVRLAANRFALVDGDTTFDRGTPGGPAPSPFTTADTRGCSCDQILMQLGHGANERALGCKAATMQEWIRQDQSLASR